MWSLPTYLYLYLSIFLSPPPHSLPSSLPVCARDCGAGYSASFKKTYGDIKNFDETWQFIKGPLFDGLYQNKWYNGEAYQRT